MSNVGASVRKGRALTAAFEEYSPSMTERSKVRLSAVTHGTVDAEDQRRGTLDSTEDMVQNPFTAGGATNYQRGNADL